MRLLALLSLVGLGLGCGAGTRGVTPAPAQPASDPASSEPAAREAPPGAVGAPAAEAKEAPLPIPTTCAPRDGVCVPDAAFVKRLCAGSFPDVALVLMGKESPASRLYLRGDVDGWNADGGASARARLRGGEEVLVLRRRAAPTNGIVVGAGGGYLVMRWDGNCYTLEDGEVTASKPPAPKHPPMPWRFYAEPTKNALLARPVVLAAYQRRGKECKGATSGEVTRACERADAELSAAIVSEIRGGLSVPVPERRP